jgi:hypothetical protein
LLDRGVVAVEFDDRRCAIELRDNRSAIAKPRVARWSRPASAGCTDDVNAAGSGGPVGRAKDVVLERARMQGLAVLHCLFDDGGVCAGGVAVVGDELYIRLGVGAFRVRTDRAKRNERSDPGDDR